MIWECAHLIQLDMLPQAVSRETLPWVNDATVAMARPKNFDYFI